MPPGHRARFAGQARALVRQGHGDGVRGRDLDRDAADLEVDLLGPVGTVLDGEFQLMSPGDFVRCAVTGEPIMLPDLRYWSVDLQEAYASADISLRRYVELRRKGKL